MPDGSARMDGPGQAQRPAVTAPDRVRARRNAVALWFAGLAVSLAPVGLAIGFGAPGTGWFLALSLVAAGLWLWQADRFMRPGGGVPVLVWHSVSADARWLPWARDISVSPETLDRQLAILRAMGCVAIDSADFVAARVDGRPVPENAVMLHFDDGYLDNWLAAAPLLQRHGMRATLFVSLDFIAPDRAAFPKTLVDPGGVKRWDGYLSWAEIAALDAGAFGGVFGVEPHGTDHIRVATGPATVDRITPQNWRRLAWMQWAAMPGAKHDWYRHDHPPARGYGTAVPQSAPALAAPAWRDGKRESDAAYDTRVRAELAACIAAFDDRLGRAPRIFCWPQNQTSDRARAIAADLGYCATTAGKGANREREPAHILSRVHVGEAVAGFRWPAADALAFRATVRAFQGNHYWYLPIVALSVLRRLHGLITGRWRR
ncbi:MAG: polysaccharide deacetylase family protein [Paracoccaceae bacterium]